MNKILFLSAFLTCSALFAQNEEAYVGIHFEHGTWTEAINKARQENKLVMLDAYTTWCGPCKWMSKNIFPLKEVGEFYNKNFISIKIDMEKGEGIDIAKKYKIQNYPIFLFVDGYGKMVHQVCGSREANDFILAGKNAMSADLSLSALQKKYEAAGSKPTDATAYFTASSEACLEAEKEVAKFLEAQKPGSLTEKENYGLLMQFINDHQHASFKYLLSNYKDFTALYPKEEIDQKISGVYSFALRKAIAGKNEKEIAAVQTAYRAEANAPGAYLDAFGNLVKAKIKNDTGAYYQAVVFLTDNYMMKDPGHLNKYAWEFYEKTNTQAYLLKAETWAKASVELAPGYANLDTYAAVLFKLGKLQEAKATAGKAIELGKKDGADIRETEDLVEKINEKMKI